MSKCNTCRFCGKELNEGYKSKLYCSYECGVSYRDEKRTMEKKMAIKRECRTCKVEFTPNYKGAKTFDCSEKCYKEQRKKQKRERFRRENGLHDKYDYEGVKKCKVCNADTSHMRINALYCSASCKQTIDDRKRGHKPLDEHLTIIGERKEQRLARLELERSRKQLRNALNKAIKFKLDAQAEQERIRELTRPCEECGGTFYDPLPHTLTCSNECRRKRTNRQAKLYNSTRLNETNIIDRDISLEKLYERDDGTCYLCGGECDYYDHTITLEGYYIVGPSYPSVDHVVALANGGMHSWDNVRLAHHLCNTLKRDIKLEEYTEALV